MTVRMVAALWLGFAVAAGCGSSGHSGDDAGKSCEPSGGPSSSTAAFHGVDYEVTGGLTGGGDGTSLQIDANGSVTRHTMQRGTEQGLLDPATFDDLVGKIRAAQFSTLCAAYPCAGCGDDYLHRISVRLDNVSYTLQASFDAVPPARLTVVIDALRAIVDRPL